MICLSKNMCLKTQIERYDENDSIYYDYGYQIHNICDDMYKTRYILCFEHNE
jgi:hypothetical protein